MDCVNKNILNDCSYDEWENIQMKIRKNKIKIITVKKK